jgi:hypothetical protein
MSSVSRRDSGEATSNETLSRHRARFDGDHLRIKHRCNRREMAVRDGDAKRREVLDICLVDSSAAQRLSSSVTLTDDPLAPLTYV